MSNISIITAQKNRTENLFLALPSWLELNVNEIIIVDWGSEVSIKNEIAEINDDRIILIEVKNQPKWCLAEAFNLAAQYAKGDLLLKLDADIKIEPNFLDYHPLKQGQFFAGNWKNARNSNEKALNGVLFVHRCDYWEINGYNEFFKIYGWEDSDLYNRLADIGLKRSDINNNLIYHLPHEDRVTNQEMGIKGIDDSKLGGIGITINRILSEILDPWSQDFSCHQYKELVVESNYFQVEEKGPSSNVVTDKVLSKIKSDAITEHLIRDGINLANEESKFNFPELLKFYKLINYKFIDKVNGEYLLFVAFPQVKNLEELYNFLESLYNNYRNESIRSIKVLTTNVDLGNDLNLYKLLDKIEISYIKSDCSLESIFDSLSGYKDESIILTKAGIQLFEGLSLSMSDAESDTVLCLTSYFEDSVTGHISLPYFRDGIPDYFNIDTFIFKKYFNCLLIDSKDSFFSDYSGAKVVSSIFFNGNYRAINPCLDVVNLSINYSYSNNFNYVNNPRSFKWLKGLRWSDLSAMKSYSFNIFSKHHNNVFVEDASLVELSVICKIASQRKYNIWLSKSASLGNIELNNYNSNVNQIRHSKLKKSVELIELEKLDDLSIGIEENQFYFIKNASNVLNIEYFERLSTRETNSTPKISIITPSYNAEEYIERAIASVQNQDYDNYEHIIVDGNSNDGTIDILKRFKHLNWVSEKDRGQSDAMNKGFQMSNGEIIVYLNADDYFLPGIFKYILECYSKGYDFIVGKCLVVSEDGSFWTNNPSYSYIDILRHWTNESFPVNPVCYFYTREIQEKVGKFSETNHYNMDLEFLVRAYEESSVFKVDKVLGVFENVAGTKTAFHTYEQEHWTKETYFFIDDAFDNESPEFAIPILEERSKLYSERSNLNMKLSKITEPSHLTNLPEWYVFNYVKANLKFVIGKRNIYNLSNNPNIRNVGLSIVEGNLEYYLLATLEHYLDKVGLEHIIFIIPESLSKHFSDLIATYDIDLSRISVFYTNLNLRIYKWSLKSYIVKSHLLDKWVFNFEFGNFIDTTLQLKINFISFLESIDSSIVNAFEGIAIERLSDQEPSIPSNKSIDLEFISNEFDQFILTRKDGYINEFETVNITPSSLESAEPSVFNLGKKQAQDLDHLYKFSNRLYGNVKLPVFYINQIKLVFFKDDNLLRYKNLIGYDSEWESDYSKSILYHANIGTIVKVEDANIVGKLGLISSVHDLKAMAEHQFGESNIVPLILDYLDGKTTSIEKNAKDRRIKLGSGKISNKQKNVTDNKEKYHEISEKLNEFYKVKEVQQAHINKIYSSLSWKIGNGFVKSYIKLFGWLPFVKTK